MKALILVLCLTPSLASAAGQVSHEDPIAAVALSLATILVTAKLGGDLAVRTGQPAVLGELVGGIVLGNLSLVGISAFTGIKTDPSLEMLARIGALILLFEVGLESTVAEMLDVGMSAMLVAIAGVVAPFALGWGVGAWLLPEHSPYVHAFLGATLSATSVGITARVLKDLGRSQSREARIILGAAVIDDVLGLVVLAVVSGVVVAADTGGHLSYRTIAAIVTKAIVFLVGSLASGSTFPRGSSARRQRCVPGAYCSPRGSRGAFSSRGSQTRSASRPSSVRLPPVSFSSLGIPQMFVERGERALPELVHPISGFLVPVFFVVMGARADLRAFTDPAIMGLAAALTIAAIAGKQACSVAVMERGIDRLSVGIGMVPRGEVGLIFANMGLALSVQGERIIDASTYSALVVMIIVTTMITPPALKWSLSRAG